MGSIKETKSDSDLTKADVKTVQTIWRAVMTDPTTHGINFFIRFFRENPTYMEWFKTLKGLTEEELKSSKRLKAHAMSVLYAITSLVDNLDDIECCDELLTKIGSNHKRRKVDHVMFQNLAKTFIGFLSDTLGSEIMNQQAVDAWGKIFTIIVEAVKRAWGDDKNEAI